MGIPQSTFYGWYRRFAESGVEALADRPPRPQRTWNRIPPERASAIVDLAWRLCSGMAASDVSATFEPALAGLD